ncbi:ATPase [Desulfomarina profundi]|uniref:ATPase n=2 Tax=Desulfomarina profundi TaxID=2772557 RepID=A0A8D5JHQ8_9BACT|nr:ATPase [Desulfomarina profundi]
MINTIKEIIFDLQEIKLETGVPRLLRIRPVTNKATVCIGVRRSGKSTFMFQIMQRLIERGVSRHNILYLNFFDDRLHNLQRGPLDAISEAYYSLYPEKKNSEKIYCFFDEIQILPGWESFVDRLIRTENCDIYITGSSAQMLSKEIATQMRGRALSWELFPFSFREFLNAKNVDHTLPFSSKKRLLIQKTFEEYWQTGGFPEVIGLDRFLRIKIHQEYFSTLLFRDLIERHDVSHPKAVTDLAHRLIDNIASLYSVNKLTGYLKSLGHKAPKSAVSEYLEWFEDAYFLFTVRIFDASLAKANVNPKKIYCIDHAMVTSTGSGILVNSGHLLENLVFVALRRISRNIFYYKTNSGREVDFIVQQQDNSRMLIQVCESMSNPKTYKREVKALKEAMYEQNLTTGTIVTFDQEEQIVIHSGKIEVMPAWRFLLNLPETM